MGQTMDIAEHSRTTIWPTYNVLRPLLFGFSGSTSVVSNRIRRRLERSRRFRSSYGGRSSSQPMLNRSQSSKIVKVHIYLTWLYSTLTLHFSVFLNSIRLKIWNLRELSIVFRFAKYQQKLSHQTRENNGSNDSCEVRPPRSAATSTEL